jgi:uncharacterized circularly permuted ATP-grasp superfamily protein/uncharacterized alpha-E superfamily protein
MPRASSTDPAYLRSDAGMPPYDELRDEAGALRPHWARYFEGLDAMGTSEAKAQWSKAKQLLQENGVSYNAYADGSGNERPWRLSPIPLLVDSRHWMHLARGVSQRARLLDGILSDLYGPQRCLLNRWLPPALVYDNPRFLRSLQGLGVQRTGWIPIYGVDLVRAPSGDFLALEDATQAPSGMGYALENRIVVSQALPDLVRRCNVERLVPFFRLLLERLQEAAPHNRDAPRIALLTPGPYSATYFEQAYLAKYLGLSLVQGEDLAVRDDRVYLKTLGGLQPIDVLLRRVFDDYCDPLELRADSVLGVPGLVQALRTGNVACLNPLGAGLVESPALLAYLPRLCRELLKEELLLPSVPTYYCGEPTQREAALSEFEQMVIKPASGEGNAGPVFVASLDGAERDALRDRLLDTPSAFVAQRFIPASKTPVIADGDLRSRSYVLRCFAHCGRPNDYQVMPGGLALVATAEDDLAVSIHRGARSKDVWVISDDSVLAETLMPPTNPPIELSRGGGDLPSRIADNLYWLGRYTERSEAVCRLARVAGVRHLDSVSSREYAQSYELRRLFDALDAQTLAPGVTESLADSGVDRSVNEAALIRAIVDAECAGSVVSALRSMMRVGRIVRDRLSHDTLRILASLEESVARCAAAKDPAQLPQLVADLNEIVLTLAAFSGLVMESMTRGFAWRFLDMGRRLERAISLVSLMRTTLAAVSEREAPLVEVVLDVADSGMTYRRRYSAGLQTAPAVDLLLADDTNPRSVIYQLHTLREHIVSLPSLGVMGAKTKQQRLLLAVTTEVELCDVVELCRVEPATGQRDGLVTLLGRLASSLPALSDSLTETYLYHANAARQLRSNVAAHDRVTAGGRS